MLPLVLIIATERRARCPGAAARGVPIRLLRPRAKPTSSRVEAGVATPLLVLITADFPPWKGSRKAWAVCAAASRVVAPARRRNLFFLVVVVMVDMEEAHCCCLLRCRPMQVVLMLVTVVGRRGVGFVCECGARRRATGG